FYSSSITSLLFFFSSRRRHTRFSRDWSSDVCSSDLVFDYLTDMQKFVLVHPVISKIDSTGQESYLVHETLKFGFVPFSFTYPARSEERRVGKECRSWWWPYHKKRRENVTPV